MDKSKLLQLSPQALFRYQVVSAVQVRVLGGMKVAQAVRDVLELPHQDLSGRPRQVSERSIYRWLDAYGQKGLMGLEPQPRPRVCDSAVLSKRLLDYLRLENKTDPEASVPELMKRARRHGIVSEDEPLSRSTVWRACRRMDLVVRRAHKLKDKDMRRFSYPNRMLMMLADGKYFRAGVGRLKRVALNFVDDATRFGLAVFVGTSETTQLFLQGLHRTILKYGLLSAMFLDRGPGFISDDTFAVVARLGIRLIHGTAAYPEGHGKIERFNQTAWQQLIRTFDSNPEVDPDPSALTLRVSHWMHQIYNHTPHESLGGQTPANRFHQDPRPLHFPEDRDWLDDCFLISFERSVSTDNVISFDGVFFEVPRGYAGHRIRLWRHLLDDSVSMIHQGERLFVHPVDVKANAYSKRAREPKIPRKTTRAVRTAATLRFQSDFAPIVGPDGSYPKGIKDDKNNK
ncbi:MAG: transposase [bacterium]|nr:transposase [bacterium]